MRISIAVTCLCIGLLNWNGARASEKLFPGTGQEPVQESAKPLEMSHEAQPSGPHLDAPPSPGVTTQATPPGSWTLFRDVPSISGQYSVGRTTLLPFVGAGFGGGYSTERERALNPALQGWSDPGLRIQGNQIRQGLTPNEFQMGVRIPF